MLYLLCLAIRHGSSHGIAAQGPHGRPADPDVVRQHLGLRSELRDVLAHADRPHDLIRAVPPSGGAPQDLAALAALREERELKVGDLLALEALGEHGPHGVREVLCDEVLHKDLAHRLLSREACQQLRLPVPLVHAAPLVHADDGRVHRADELLQILNRELGLEPLAARLREVVANVEGALQGAFGTAAGRGAEEDVVPGVACRT
mmetsp:Transcript_108474/g.317353  ORF Transcript_108474/g.317353 Transcript_108474/m.317353 type:complete len:205 (-) Transcript_108474:645-1259(-)